MCCCCFLIQTQTLSADLDIKMPVLKYLITIKFTPAVLYKSKTTKSNSNNVQHI